MSLVFIGCCFVGYFGKFNEMVQFDIRSFLFSHI